MTIKDIAKQCGVSVSTVSRVINERPDVSPSVRETVLDAIRRSNFIPNNSARSLVSVKSDNIGLVVRGISNIFYADIISAIERAVAARGYTLVMQQIGTLADEIKCGAVMEREKKLKGIIFLGGRSDYTPEELGPITVPFVCCTYDNSFGSVGEGLSSVSIDDELTAYKAVSLLCSMGHRKIAALVSDARDRSISELRYRGYKRALIEHGIEPDEALVCSAGSFEMADAYTATKKLAQSADFTAMFIISDAMALAAIKALEDSNLSVPNDCSVIAIDGIALSLYSLPTLTTMCQPCEEMGAESVRILLDRIELGAQWQREVLPSVLREGGSVKPPRVK